MAFTPSLFSKFSYRRFEARLRRVARAKVKETPHRWRLYLLKLLWMKLTLVATIVAALSVWLLVYLVVFGISAAAGRALWQRHGAVEAAAIVRNFACLFSLGAMCLLPWGCYAYSGFAGRARLLPYYPLDLAAELRRNLVFRFLRFQFVILLPFILMVYGFAGALQGRLAGLAWGLALGLLTCLLLGILIIVFGHLFSRWAIIGLLAAGIIFLLLAFFCLLMALNPPDSAEAARNPQVAFILSCWKLAGRTAAALWWTPFGAVNLGLEACIRGKLDSGLAILSYPVVVLAGVGCYAWRMPLTRLIKQICYREKTGRMPPIQTAIGKAEKRHLTERLKRREFLELPDFKKGGWFGLLLRRVFSRQDQLALDLLLQGRAYWRSRWYLALAALLLGLLGLALPARMLHEMPEAPTVIQVLAIIGATIIFLPNCMQLPGFKLTYGTGRQSPVFAYFPITYAQIVTVMTRVHVLRCAIWLAVVLVWLRCLRITTPGPSIISAKLAWFVACSYPAVMVIIIHNRTVDPEFLPIRKLLVEVPMSLCFLGGYLLAAFLTFSSGVLALAGLALTPLVSLMLYFSYKWYYRSFLDLTIVRYNWQGKPMDEMSARKR